MATSSRVIFSMYDGAFSRLRPITLPRLEAYARRHGYDVQLVQPVDGLHPAWARVRVFLTAIARRDVAVWIDADAIVLDGSRDIADTVRYGAFQAVPWDPRFGWCPCVWAIRAGDEASSLLRSVWSRRFDGYPDEEQGALASVLSESPALAQRTVRLGSVWHNNDGSHSAPRIQHLGYQAGDVTARARALRKLVRSRGA